jgi:hypothetical protein
MVNFLPVNPNLLIVEEGMSICLGGGGVLLLHVKIMGRTGRLKNKLILHSNRGVL